MTITTYHDDCLTVLPTLAPGSVQALISSPPFYGLRAYSIPPSAWPEVRYAPMPGLAPLTIAPMVCQLGAEPTPEAYTAHLVYVMRLARAAIRGDGVVWLNFGDSYASSGTPGKQSGTAHLWDHGSNGHNPKMNEQVFGRAPTPAGLSEKNLLGIPWRAAFALQADGWVLRSDVIWAKSNCMPESVRDRPTRAHEYVFLFGKSKIYYYDSAAVAEPTSERSTFTAWNGHPTPYASGSDNPNHAKLGNGSRGSASGRNLRSVWTIPTTPSSFADDCPACYGTGIDRLALRGAHDRMRDTDAWRAWAADQPRCAACQGSGRVGEDHFAVWPPALVEIMIKASTAARACAVCGAAWGRVVERTDEVDPSAKGSRFDRGKTGVNGNGRVQEGERYAKRAGGFAPRCACADDGAGRSVVLDPFAGSGTTLAVAERLGRDSIGIDLGYEQARAKRLGAVQTSMEALL